MILNEDATSKAPDGNDAAGYVNATKIKSFAEKIPVTVDPTMTQVLDGTPWNGNARPGKCAISPKMKILECYTGEDDTQAFEAIKKDAGL